jgi:hypothetical protein
MSNHYDDFDLDVRLSGVPHRLVSLEKTEDKECTNDFTCIEADCIRRTEAETCDGLAHTCNSCEESCFGTCDDTCEGQVTCPVNTCAVTCITVTCPEQSCGCNTVETCDLQICHGLESQGEDCQSDETCHACPGPGGGGGGGDD